jgi:hypothetical protein
VKPTNTHKPCNETEGGSRTIAVVRRPEGPATELATWS